MDRKISELFRIYERGSKIFECLSLFSCTPPFVTLETSLFRKIYIFLRSFSPSVPIFPFSETLAGLGGGGNESFPPLALSVPVSPLVDIYRGWTRVIVKRVNCTAPARKLLTRMGMPRPSQYLLTKTEHRIHSHERWISNGISNILTFSFLAKSDWNAYDL